MANLGAVLKEEIRRLARRELRSEISALRKNSAQQRRDIAALKRLVDSHQRELRFLEKQEKRRITKGPAPVATERRIRFSAAGLKTHRSKVGLSAADYGRLLGVSGLSVYNWEAGKNRPRKSQLAKLVTVRGLGKREAAKRLAMLGE